MVNNAVKILKEKYGISKVDMAIVAGSGLAGALPDLTEKIVVGYDELGLPPSKVKGHAGNFVFGKHNGKLLAYVSRIHFYESGKIENVRLPFEIISALGCEKIILLTSSGGINNTYRIGDLMLIKDHINFTGTNPLVGIEKMEFTNMGDCYNLKWRNEIKNIAKEKGIDLKEGVFVQMSGPSYETISEINMLRLLGGDAVSMSTAFDCIICNYLKMKVAGFSVIVNTFSGGDDNLTHQEVLDNAFKASQNLKIILEKAVEFNNF